MRTDKGAYIIDGGAAPQASLRYDGVIQSYLMQGVALYRRKIAAGQRFPDQNQRALYR